MFKIKVYAEVPVSMWEPIGKIRKSHDSLLEKIPSEAYKEDFKLRNGELKKLIKSWEEPIERLEELLEESYIEVSIFGYLFSNPQLKLTEEIDHNLKLFEERFETLVEYLDTHFMKLNN